MKLTLAKIKAAKPATQTSGHRRHAKFGDGRGLWLMVDPNGRKTWAFLYTINKKSRHMGLGSLDFMGLDEARNRALELRRLVKAGIDPKAQIEAERAASDPAITAAATVPTFREVADRYMAANAPTEGGNNLRKWSPKTHTSWKGTMRDYILPAIGDKPVDAVTSDDVAAILRPIWDTVPVYADRVKGRIGVVLSFAAAKKWRADDNITRAGGPLDFEFKPHGKAGVKNHDAMDYTALPALMTDLRANWQGFAPRALELLILTAARTSEVLAMTWGEIDLDNRVWIVPAERMKMGKQHVVPLNDAALALLKSMPRELGNPYVFPSPRTANAPLSNMALSKVLERMGRKQGVTVHGFRTTFRTWAAERNLDIPKEVAEAALAHVVQGVEGVYQRGTYLETRRELMDRWARFAGGGA